MEGGAVGQPSSENKQTYTRYTEAFENAFPYYLAIGMPSDEYWNGDCRLVKWYREAQERKTNHENYMRWLQGYYIYYAIGAMSPALNALAKNHKPKDYIERPIPITQSATEEAEIEKMKKMAQNMQAWARIFNGKAEEQGVNGDTS